MSAHPLTSQVDVRAASDRAVSASRNETSAPGDGSILKAHSIKANTTVYGGEDGFTSRMDFTSCVGPLNPTLTATGREGRVNFVFCDKV